MGLETATKISELVPTNPTGTDPKSQGDDHLRMIKNVLQLDAVAKTGPQTMAGPLTISDTSGQLAGFRNKIINGGFQVWQRGLSGSLEGFSADRWNIGSDGTVAWVDNGSGPNQNESSAMSVTITGGTYAYVRQGIENVNTLANGKATASVWLYVDAPKTANIRLVQNFGTGGSPEVTIASPPINVIAGWNKYAHTFDVPSTSGKTINANNTLYLDLVFSGSYGSVIASEVQLEKGSIATPFEQRPIGYELDASRRYFRRYASVQNTGDLGYQMRGVPIQSGSGPYDYSAEL